MNRNFTRPFIHSLTTIALTVLGLLLYTQTNAQTNLALGKTVTSSSLLSAGSYPNSNLTDGNINTFAHTDNTAVAPNAAEYFTIDLGSDQIIERVRVINRVGCCGDRARRFMLISWPSAVAGAGGLGNNPDTYLNDSRYNRLAYTDPAPVGGNPLLGAIVGAANANLGPVYDSLTLNVGIHKARYIMILSLQDDYLNLAEVKVFAGPPPIRGFINSGFESALSSGGFPSGSFSQISEAIVPGWSTTEAVAMYGANTTATPAINLASTDPTGGGRIEIWNSGYLSVPSYEGTYFAELNAYTNGELSQQPICVQPGELFSWSFAHRGRAGVDVMRLRIDDIDIAEFSDNNATTGTHSSSLLTPATTVISGQDATTASGWTRYYGTWTNISASSQIVQFSFRAVSSAGGSAGAGNFLDAISIGNLSATVSFNKLIASGTEHQPTANLPMIWVNGSVTTPQTVNLIITGGTATRGTDYTTPTATTGAITVTIPIGIYDGTDETAIDLASYLNVSQDANNGEPNETIAMQLQSPSSGLRIATTSDCIIVPVSHTYTIVDYIPLPVTLHSFNAAVIGCTAQLNWVSASEMNNDIYDVERSNDGHHFNSIGQVKSENAAFGAAYSFTDRYPLDGINYYRLKMIDRNGVYTYSNTVQIITHCHSIQIAPNPVKEYLAITGLSSGTHTVTIYTADGKLVHSQTTANTFVQVTMKGMSAGTYIVQVSNAEGILTSNTIIKE